MRFKKDTGYGRAIETKRVGLSEIVKGVWCEFLLIEWKKTQAGFGKVLGGWCCWGWGRVQ